ncbi:hypothetical protein BCV70DRAFT_219387 [Testicularia cyperi]|uniref:Ubinuclein middle domain-containing protein n=1 Tax=Testicularia cyperi TaxID=1882483 RepID=A0A317XIZ5_9BASI|nr:hypothetical protein BCV70DRAFT_219387 [Testicularia cyperi]
MYVQVSGASSNLTEKLNTPAHESTRRFVEQSNAGIFTLDGERGSGKSQLCAKQADGRFNCVEIALEAKSLFTTMQSLNFFCTLPQDPTKTHINCQRIPSSVRMPALPADVIEIGSSSSSQRSSSPLPIPVVRKMSGSVRDEDVEMPRSSAASRVSLANLLGPSGPGSAPYTPSPRTSPRKRLSDARSPSQTTLSQLSRQQAQQSSQSPNAHSHARSDSHRSAASSSKLDHDRDEPMHDAADEFPEKLEQVEGPAEADGDEEPNEEDEDEDDDEDDDDDDRPTTDAGSASEAEGDAGAEKGDKVDEGSGKDAPKSGDKPAIANKKKRRRTPSPPEAAQAPPAPKRPTVRLSILEARQSGYLINVPELVLENLKAKSHPWAAWYEEQLLEAAEPPAPAPAAATVPPPDLEGFGGLAKLLAKYPSGEGGGAGGEGGGASKKRRRGKEDDKYDIGQYDVRDPFVDDSELNIDEPTHFAKPKADGFYVTQGTVELAKAKNAAGVNLKGQPVAAKDRPKPLSIRESKQGFAGSINKLVARKAQQGAELPPLPPASTSTMQVDSLLNSPDKSSGGGAASALSNSAPPAEGTKDSPIKVDDNDTSSSKAAKKNRYPTLPVDPRLQAAFDDLKQKVEQESFAVKTKFPPGLKPPLIETAKLAVMLGEYDDNFFNHLPTIFPYNRFTMMKLVKREFFPHHIKYFEELKQDHMNKFTDMIRESLPAQRAEFEAAHKAWVERGEVPKDTEGDGPRSGGSGGAAGSGDDAEMGNASVDADGAGQVEDETIEPTKRWRWTEEMREEVFILITIENAMSEIRNEKFKLENSAEQYSEINARKACYKQMAELFPEDGWTTSTNISREYAQLKKKKDRQEARGEDVFGESRASSVVPA